MLNKGDFNESVFSNFVESRVGSIKIRDRDFSFREYVGKVNTEVQLVRVYNEASNPSGGSVTIHRADLAGPFVLINIGSPSSEAKDGEPTCIQGDDTSF